jgi:hypothetical protein
MPASSKVRSVYFWRVAAGEVAWVESNTKVNPELRFQSGTRLCRRRLDGALSVYN